MSDHKYKLKYKFENICGEFTAEEIKAAEMGGTDALLVFSCIFPEDGSLSVSHFSFDGRKGGQEMTPREVFKLWMMLGRSLSENPGLSEACQELASFPVETYYRLFMKDKIQKTT